MRERRRDRPGQAGHQKSAPVHCWDVSADPGRGQVGPFHPDPPPGAYTPAAMLTLTPTDRAATREIAGFLLSLTFAGSTAVRDVYLGGLFQRVDPLLVALTAFALCSLVFLPVALARDPGGVAALLRRPAPLFWINATTGFAWLSFFFALKTIEPALVQVLFYGIGPLSVRWVDGLVPSSLRTTLGAGSGCCSSA